MINNDNQPNFDGDEIDSSQTSDSSGASAGDAGVAAADVTADLDQSSPEALLAALKASEAKANEHWQRYLRTAAEMENVRKRALRDVEHAHKYGFEKFAGDILNVLDSLSMGLEAARESATIESLLEGSEATHRLLNQVLARHGVTEINPQDQPFNPELHQAMTTVDAPDVAPNTVVQVIQPGYEINGRLLRAARVLVSKG